MAGHVFSNGRVQSKRLASHLWKDFFNMIELKDNMRQRNDQPFSSLLNRIQTGDHTQEDIAILQTRKTESNQVDLSKPPFASALRLFPRVSDCDLYNDQELHKLGSATVLLFEASHVILENRRCTYGAVSCEHVREELISTDDKECGGLPRQLKLAVGGEVMLRRNIKCGDGLVNGARGIIVGFKWPGNMESQPSSGALPEYVFIKFHDPRVGQLSKVPIESVQQVPIEPMSVRFYGRQDTVLQRTQLPIILCWAATLHKVQGLSLDAAVLDLGDKVFEPGMAYVALSRVRTLDGVALSRFEPEMIKANKRVHAEMARLRQRSTPCDESDSGTAPSHIPVEDSSPPTKSSQPTNSIPAVTLPVHLVLSPTQSPNISVPEVPTTTVLSLQQSLHAMVSCRNPSIDLIREWIESHDGQIRAALFEVNHSSRACLDTSHHEDVNVLEKLLPAFTSQYVPVYTSGSGICMYNMLSIALTGTERYMCHLRLLTACSLVTHRDHMVEVMKPSAQVLLPQSERNAASIAKKAENEWLDLLRSSVREGAWGNQYHLHILSIALERSICVYGNM